MARLLASNLPEKSVKERIRAPEWNALVRAHKSGTQPGFSPTTKVREASEWMEFTTTSNVPAYSIFSLTAGETWQDPVRFVAKQIGISSHGSHVTMFTNGSTAIPSGSIGLARPVNDFASSRIAYTSPAPVVGRPCGPRLDTWTIDGERFGLVCLAVDTSESRAEVIRTPEIIGALAEVTTKITAFDEDTDKLGVGAAKLLARTASTDILASILDPGAAGSPPAWVLPVYSTRDTPVEVGALVEVTSMLGVGLVIGSEGGEGGALPVELKKDLVKFGGTEVWFLDDDGLRTSDYETARDILGFYEGVGSEGSGGTDDEGDKGWVRRLADGRLKLVALSCDPPGNNVVETPPSPPPPEPESESESLADEEPGGVLEPFIFAPPI